MQYSAIAVNEDLLTAFKEGITIYLMHLIRNPAPSSHDIKISLSDRIHENYAGPRFGAIGNYPARCYHPSAIAPMA